MDHQSFPHSHGMPSHQSFPANVGYPSHHHSASPSYYPPGPSSPYVFSQNSGTSQSRHHPRRYVGCFQIWLELFSGINKSIGSVHLSHTLLQGQTLSLVGPRQCKGIYSTLRGFGSQCKRRHITNGPTLAHPHMWSTRQNITSPKALQCRE